MKRLYPEPAAQLEAQHSESSVRSCPACDGARGKFTPENSEFWCECPVCQGAGKVPEDHEIHYENNH